MQPALTLADVDAMIAAADVRLRRKIRHAELDHEAETAPLLKARQPMLEAERATAAAAMGVRLTYAEIVRVRPMGKSREIAAIKQDVRRALKREPIEVSKRDGRPTFPPDWLRRHGIIA